MSEAARSRTAGVTLATVFLAGATVYATHDKRRYASNNAHLAKSFEARASEWTDDARTIDECGYRPDDDHCYRALYRSLIEAYEAGADYDEVARTSRTGDAFVKPTSVRRAPERTTYATKGCHRETDEWACCATD